MASASPRTHLPEQPAPPTTTQPPPQHHAPRCTQGRGDGDMGPHPHALLELASVGCCETDHSLHTPHPLIITALPSLLAPRSSLLALASLALPLSHLLLSSPVLSPKPRVAKPTLSKAYPCTPYVSNLPFHQVGYRRGSHSGGEALGHRGSRWFAAGGWLLRRTFEAAAGSGNSVPGRVYRCMP